MSAITLPQRTEIDAIAEDWAETSMRLNPALAIRLGRPSAGFADYSPDGAEALAEAARGARRRLAAAEARHLQDRVTGRELDRELSQWLAEHEAGLVVGRLNVIDSPPQEIRNAFDLMPRRSEADWTRIAESLRAVREALSGYGRSLVERVSRGAGLQRSQAVAVAAQARRAERTVLPGIARDPGVPAAFRPDLERAARLAAEAFGDLARLLERQIAPRATQPEACGVDVYALSSRRFLGAGIDLEEHYEWGVRLLAEIAEQQLSVAERVCGERSVRSAIAALDEDASRVVHGSEALQRWLQDTSDEAVDALAGTHFDIGDEHRALACRIAPAQDGGIYYTEPSLDGSRPGTMWWSVPPGVDTFRTWRERTTVYHEGVPGHHLQMGGAALDRGLNTWRRALAGTSGHREGWALYAERFMQEIGFVDDPRDLLGALDAQRMRAARVVLDIGLHTGMPRPDGRGGWDAAYAFEFMRENTVMSDPSLRYEVLRYLGWPGQAASYSIGQRAWLRARSSYLAREGTTLRGFHGRALSYGGLGLETFEWAMAQTDPGAPA